MHIERRYGTAEAELLRQLWNGTPSPEEERQSAEAVERIRHAAFCRGAPSPAFRPDKEARFDQLCPQALALAGALALDVCIDRPDRRCAVIRFSAETLFLLENAPHGARCRRTLAELFTDADEVILRRCADEPLVLLEFSFHFF